MVPNHCSLTYHYTIMLVTGKSLKMDLTHITGMLAWPTTQPTIVGDFILFLHAQAKLRLAYEKSLCNSNYKCTLQ